MVIWSALALVFALLEILAASRGMRRLEYLAKPAAMLFLFIWLVQAIGFSGPGLWFGLGVLFSLAGDVLLIFDDRFFLLGLVSFLVAQLAYLVGFNILLPPLSIWTLLLAVILGLGAARVLRRLVAAVQAQGQSRMTIPIMVYGMAITLMLLSAMLTLSNPAWGAWASLSAAVGAFLFYLSDIVLAWNKFVAALPRGRLLNISLYEFGQFLLILGVILQFSVI
jgi:uncharacterized membrane protein YhhN